MEIMSKKGAVGVNDLCLARFNTRYFSDSVRDWQNKSPVITADSCSAQVLYGKKAAFNNLPYPENAAAVKLHHGKEAYKFLLELVSGLRSKRLGETHVRKQFMDGWRVFSQDKLEDSIPFQKIVSFVKKDVNFLEREVGFGPKDLRRVTMVRDMSGQIKGDTVLIIPSINKVGKIGEFTGDMIFLTENKQDPAKKMSGRDHFLRIMSHNSSVQNAMINEVALLKAGNRVRSNIDFVSIDKIVAQFEECDRVYIDLPMGTDEIAERKIIDAWKNRTRTDNTLTHIRGNPYTRMQSTPLWENAGLEGTGCILPEQITEETTFARNNAQFIAEKVKQTIEELAALRAKGCRNPHKVIEEVFNKNVPEEEAIGAFVFEPE